MTEKERKAAASKVFQAVGEALNKVTSIKMEAAKKEKTIRKSIDNEDVRINVRGAFKVMAYSEQIEGAWRILSTLNPLIERLLWDGEADQFEELLEMVEEAKGDANADAYEINRIYYRTFGK